MARIRTTSMTLFLYLQTRFLQIVLSALCNFRFQFQVGPFGNPSEVYHYYSLPFCAPDTIEHDDHGIGEHLRGDRKAFTPYEIDFLAAIEWRVLCKKKLNRKQVEAFEHAVENEYYFEMFVDDLPVWGLIGEAEKEDMLLGHTADSRHFIFTHLDFNISYNGDKVLVFFFQQEGLPSSSGQIFHCRQSKEKNILWAKAE